MNGKKKSLIAVICVILAVCVIGGMAFSVVTFKKEFGSVYAFGKIDFTFETAAEGKTPNGKKFGVEDISKDAILQQGLVYAKLDGKYTPDQIRPCLITKGVYPADIEKQMTAYDSLLDFTESRKVNVKEFYPTQYSVKLISDFDPAVSQADLEKLLSGILRAYREKFIADHSLSFTVDKYGTLLTLEDYDYPQMLQSIQQDVDQTARYAEELYEQEPTFLYQGKGFNDIYVRCNNLVENDIVRLNANLTMNALTKDTNRLLMQYQWEMRDLDNRLEKKNAEMASLEKLIAAYDKNEIIYLSTADSLTKIDGNSSETYDALMDQRKAVSDEITEIRSQMNGYQLKINDLLKNTGVVVEEPSENETEAAGDAGTAPVVTKTAANKVSEETKERIRKLEADIASLLEKKALVEQDFDVMLKAYNAMMVNENTVIVSDVTYNAPEWISGAFIKHCVKKVGPFGALGLLLCVFLKIRKERKKA